MSLVEWVDCGLKWQGEPHLQCSCALFPIVVFFGLPASKLQGDNTSAKAFVQIKVWNNQSDSGDNLRSNLVCMSHNGSNSIINKIPRIRNIDLVRYL